MFRWEDVFITLTIIVVVALLAAGLLIGQAIRDDRAQTVVAGEYMTSIYVPEGFACSGTMVEPNIYTVVCSPWK